MVKITLYAQPLKSEPYLNITTFTPADPADAEKIVSVKALTDIGRQVCETAQGIDEEASIAGTSVLGSSFEWGLRIYLTNLSIDITALKYGPEPIDVQDHFIKIDLNGGQASIKSFIRKFVSDLGREPYHITNWENFLMGMKITKEDVITSWQNVLGLAAPTAGDDGKDVEEIVEEPAKLDVPPADTKAPVTPAVVSAPKPTITATPRTEPINIEDEVLPPPPAEAEVTVGVQPQVIPEVTPPEDTPPDVTLPEVTPPEVTPPEVITPEVTPPEIITPEVTPPEIITPPPEPVAKVEKKPKVDAKKKKGAKPDLTPVVTEKPELPVAPKEEGILEPEIYPTLEPTAVEPAPPSVQQPSPVQIPRKVHPIQMRLKSEPKISDTRPCPKCKTIVPVDSTQDPILFHCPNCGLKGKFKRKKKLMPQPLPQVAEEGAPGPETQAKPVVIPVEEAAEPKLPEAPEARAPEVPTKPQVPKVPKVIGKDEKEELVPKVISEAEPAPEPEPKPEVTEAEPREVTVEKEIEAEAVIEPEPEPELEAEPAPEPEPKPEVTEAEPRAVTIEKEVEAEAVIEPEPEPELEPEPAPEPKRVEVPKEIRIREYFETAEGYKQRNQYIDAAKYYDMVLELDPDYFDALNGKGLILYANRKFESAIEQFDKVLRLDKYNSEAIINKAVSLNRLDRREDALELYDTLLEHDKSSTAAWSNKGVLLFTMNRYADAEDALENAVELAPEDEEAWLNLAIIQERLGKYRDAAKAYEKVIKFNPENSQADKGLQNCLREARYELLREWKL